MDRFPPPNDGPDFVAAIIPNPRPAAADELKDDDVAAALVAGNNVLDLISAEPFPTSARIRRVELPRHEMTLVCVRDHTAVLPPDERPTVTVDGHEYTVTSQTLAAVFRDRTLVGVVGSYCYGDPLNPEHWVTAQCDVSTTPETTFADALAGMAENKRGEIVTILDDIGAEIEHAAERSRR